MVHHNNMLPNIHLGKDWQEKVKTWFNQPGRKHRRQRNRLRKAKLTAPNPTHTLKPIVRGQTNKYNTKIKLGRGFTKEELKKAGILSVPYARSIGIAIDLRRKDCSVEAPLPKPEPGYSFAPITDEMKKKNVYETQRKEIKTAKGFYKRLEAAKKKGKK